VSKIKIAVVSTGGTIAMKNIGNGLASPALTGDDLMACIPAVGNQRPVETFSYCNVPSSYLTLKDLAGLRQFIYGLKKKGFSGVVITHGTDTMEETAFFLDITAPDGIAIVLTGAQRNASLPSSDGTVNLMDSILVASDKRTATMGVVVVFASEILPAREVTKHHRTRVDTFKALEFGPLGTVSNDRVIWYREPLIRYTYNLGSVDKRVDIIPCYLGADSRGIFNYLKEGVDGLVVDATGAGHVPPAMLEGIIKAVDSGIPVVMTSRVPIGRLLTDTYGYIGAERYLRDIGVIFGEDLPAWKARLKLVVLLSNGLSVDEIRHEFERYFYNSSQRT
jgi:L-asparaginase